MPSPRTEQAIARLADLTPRQIVAELDRYIVGQAEAKKSVAIALRNRWRRQRAPESIREEISPNNIILIGPTGVGKTEIARRLAKLAGAPFVKVEASKFTEVGYVGRDVESMVRDLVENAIDMVRTERESEVEDLANEKVDERLLDLLPPARREGRRQAADRSGNGARGATPAEPAAAGTVASRHVVGRDGVFAVSSTGAVRRNAGTDADGERARALSSHAREAQEPAARRPPRRPRGRDRGDAVRPGMPDDDDDRARRRAWRTSPTWFRDMMPKRKKKRTVKVSEARRILLDEELEKLIDLDDVTPMRSSVSSRMGIIFLDEIDKIAGERGAGRRRPTCRARACSATCCRSSKAATCRRKLRHREDRPRPLHRRRRVPRVEAERPDPRAAGPLPDPRRAQAAHGGRTSSAS